MKDFFVERTHYTPEILCSVSGQLSVKGFSIVENSIEIYGPLMDWIRSFEEKNKAVILDLKFEFIDTASVRAIVEIVKILNAYHNTDTIAINWYYEKYDTDLFEIGEAIRSVSKFQFNLIGVEIDDLEI